MLCEIFAVSVIVLSENYLWKLEEKSLDDFHMYFVMFKGGRFMSATGRNCQKFLLQLPEELHSLMNSILSTDGVMSAAPNFQILAKWKRGHPKKVDKQDSSVGNASDLVTHR